MSRLRKAKVLVAALAVAVVVPGSAAASPAGPGTGTGSPTGDVRSATADTVTLITGDRVTVHVSPDGSLVGDVHPAPDRGQIPFIQESGPGRLRVFPADAASLVTAGRLDARLFDVAYLLKEGYGDRSRADIPLIASYDQGRRPQAAVTTARATSVRALPAVRGDALEVRKADAPQFWSTMGGPQAKSIGVRKIWLDGKVTATLNESVPQIGVPDAWQAGLTGADVTVAVLDTGVDKNHPDLTDAVAEAKDFTGTTPEAHDGHGHGTHVASIVAGRGTAAAGAYTGVAKGGRLAVGKVLDDTGTGQWSWVIAGMEWAARNSGAKVINMSLGGTDTPGIDPVEEAVNQLTAETGALFVIAAGNAGPGAQTVGTPGSADAALTVAAVDKTDAVASFSSRGPRVGDYAVKPDIAAPGVNIAAARAAGTSMPGSTPIDANYTRASGTSMATPHVAGVAAILAQQHPDWKAEHLKAALASSAKPLAGTDTYAVGAGRVDAAKAVTEQVYATSASVSFGYLKWPYASAEPIDRTVTYRNDSETAVTLDLSLQVTDANGTPAQAGTFTVTPATLTVPAKSAASAVVTFAAGTGPAGRYGGALTATSADGAHTARVALGGSKEPESYDVTVTALDRDGNLPGPGAWFNMVIFFDYATGEFHGPVPSGTTARLPAGNYAANAYISTARPGKLYPAVAQMAIPDLRVTQDAAVTLDSRAAQRLTFTVDDSPTAALQYRYQHMLVKYPAGGPVTYFSWTMGTSGDFDEVYVSAANTSDKFAFAAQARLKDATGSAYNLAFPSYRQVPDVDYHVRTMDLGQVDTTYRGLGGESRFSVGALPAYFGRFLFKLSETQTAPATRTEYFSAGIPTYQTVEPLAWTKLRTLRAGERRTETFNDGVIGPSFATPPPPSFEGYGPTRPAWAYRDGDVIDVRIPMLVDAGPGHLPAMMSSFPIPGYARLYRDGVLVGQSGQPAAGVFPVPAEPGEYRLEAFHACNTTFCAVSNPTAYASWTFRSDHTGDVEALPLMAVRYLPELDEHNRASADVPFTFPVELETETWRTKASTTSLTVEASYDDGGTWHSVQLRRVGKTWQATVDNPGSGYVSLRATAQDAGGNTVQQTVLRAYGVIG